MEEAAEAVLEAPEVLEVEVQEEEVLESKLLKRLLEVVTTGLIMTDGDDTTVVTQAAQVLEQKVVGI